VSDEDLGALLAGATRRLIEEERPLLEAHGLTMWGYIALSRLAAEPAASQLLLAESMGYDKTRLITLLDALEANGLLTRQPDPTDRRARIIALTPTGRKLHRAAHRSILAMEKRLLSEISEADIQRLRDILGGLAGAD
jgi:DNA-binding MarR family transcriptional regulator